MASASSVPLWVTIALGTVPIVAAVIAGSVALANTIGRRLERLKNLVEIEQKIPKWINYDQGLERLMILELKGIERATTPWYRLYYRIVGAFLLIFIAAMGITFLPGIFGTALQSYILLGVNGVVLVFAVFDLRMGSRWQDLDEATHGRTEILEYMRRSKEIGKQPETVEEENEEESLA